MTCRRPLAIVTDVPVEAVDELVLRVATGDAYGAVYAVGCVWGNLTLPPGTPYVSVCIVWWTYPLARPEKLVLGVCGSVKNITVVSYQYLS